jgi:PEGA domain-containing protein
VTPILDDDWEPPPRTDPRRWPVVLASALLIAGVAVVTIHAGVWEPAAGKQHAPWYPDDSVKSPWSPIEPARVPGDFHHQAPQPRSLPRPGYLAINSTPWAELSVDGHVVGNTPQLRIRVTAGRHRLVLARDGFATHRTWVTVAPGATVRITDIALQRIAP